MTPDQFERFIHAILCLVFAMLFCTFVIGWLLIAINRTLKRGDFNDKPISQRGRW